jgi:hypothetical protein
MIIKFRNKRLGTNTLMSYHLSLHNGVPTETTISFDVNGHTVTAHLQGFDRTRQFPLCNLVVHSSHVPRHIITTYIDALIASSPDVPIILSTRDHNYSYNDDQCVFTHCVRFGNSAEELLKFSAGLLFGNQDLITIK